MSENGPSYAQIRALERGLESIGNTIANVDSNVISVERSVDAANSKIQVVYDQVSDLAREFNEYVSVQKRANRLNQAETRLVKIRQELEKKYGHYDIVRRTTTGILQADDLGIVKKETISNATEELMISTPGYWLAPCLVALAAWINDQQELAEKALKEGIKRDDEKTSLFFALICRRADRKDACLLWTQRYLANQNEEDLDRNTIIILDAYAGGLLGADSEGVIKKQIDEWMARLESKPGFVEQQKDQWSEAINLKRKPIDTSSYTYLRKYSKKWPILEDILEGAHLHAEMLGYLKGIFEQESSTSEVKKQLDEIVDSLVTNYDNEELPLRKEEKYEQYIVDFDGDEDRARQNMSIEETAYEEHKDFTQLLTDAAMKPDASNASVSTQKYAFALSKEWVTAAYDDIVATNRMKVPNEIDITMEIVSGVEFSGKTNDGENEAALINQYDAQVEEERAKALSECVLSGFDNFCLIGGAAIAVVGAIMAVIGGTGTTFLGILAVIAAIGLLVKFFVAKKAVDNGQVAIGAKFDELKTEGEKIIRATLAEVVDFRIEYKERESESEQVSDYLDTLSTEQYVNQLEGSNRRIVM